MTNKRLLTAEDIIGAWAIMPTPAKPNASDWREDNTVDLEETVRVINALIDSGVDGILSMGTLGECATLTWDEKYQFMKAAIDAVGGRVPFFVGTSSLNTRDTIWQTRQAEKLGADGTMLGVPMWCNVDVATAVQFYRDVASACPNMAICVYANSEAFNFEFPRPFWAQVSQIPQVVCTKYMGIAQLNTDLGLTQGRIRFLPIDMDYYAAAKIDPEQCRAFWTSGAVCGPAPSIKLRDEVAKAKQTGEWESVRALTSEITQSFVPLIPRGSFPEFSKYNIGLEKARMNAAGWMNAGPFRPPYHIVPEEYLAGARKSGVMWADLHKRYSVQCIEK